MKYLVVLFAIFAVVAADDEWLPRNAEGIRDVHRECAKEVDLTTEQREKVENFEFPDEEKVRNYVLCFGRKLRVFCRHSGYHPIRVYQQLDLKADDVEVLGIVKECADDNEQNSTTDVWAYRGQQCILNSKLGDEIRGIFKEQKEKLAKKDAEAA